MKLAFAVLLAFGVQCALADEQVVFCFNWSCANQTTLVFAESSLNELRDLILDADSPAHERELLAAAVGRMIGWAGQSTDLGADRAGNRDDAEVNGRMDCIDHSTNTTAIMRMFERRGWLHFHRVDEPRFRNRLLFPVHRAAVIEEMPPGLGVIGGDGNEQFSGRRFVVDSWFVDPGETPVVMPLGEWLAGGGPDVE